MTTASSPPSPHGRASAPRVLCVDDDAAVLRALRRVLAGTYDVAIAVGGLAGLEAIRDASPPFAVVITDLRMPELSGIGLLQCVRQQSPQTTRVLLTGNADVASATAAVNAGEVFRFLAKPCAPDALLEAVGAAYAHHQRLTSPPRVDGIDTPRQEPAEGADARDAAPAVERGQARAAVPSHAARASRTRGDTLSELVLALNVMLAAVHPVARACAARIEWRANSMLDRLDLGIDQHVRAAAALSQLGAISLSPEVAERIYGSLPLSAADAGIAHGIRVRTWELIADVPALALARQIVWCDPQGDSVDLTSDTNEIELGTVIVDIACMLDDGQRKGRDVGRVLAELQLHHGGRHAGLMDSLHAEIDSLAGHGVRMLRLRDASPEMTLATDVFTPNGLLMACRGQRIGDILTHQRSLTWSDAMLEQLVEVVAPAAHPDFVTT